MFSILRLTLLATLATSALATPIAPSTSLPLPLSRTVLSAAPHAPLLNASSRVPAALAVRQEFPAQLFLCSIANCATCFVPIDLSEFAADVCHAAPSFVSAGVVQPSGAGLPFAVLVGPPGCAEFAQIPEVNECFNLAEAFDQWALLD
ncbi:uncharacterized protein BXZ73DRAFT_102448 [Epithele typhae]|uniref:uncharacterized protein n=1 Tax=Epithele typhae TaxID=378194 RepID=UPI002008454D|nr:uncharacterized protein BXZ73DRAFT_102448 [Epithele typhae]KAH9927940.1 hypothetical protein BXZ73DRAFT_102448 [Epithele typhae]